MFCPFNDNFISFIKLSINYWELYVLYLFILKNAFAKLSWRLQQYVKFFKYSITMNSG